MDRIFTRIGEGMHSTSTVACACVASCVKVWPACGMYNTGIRQCARRPCIYGAPMVLAGAQDRICRGESTLAVEMLETSSLLHHSTPASLVVRVNVMVCGLLVVDLWRCWRRPPCCTTRHLPRWWCVGRGLKTCGPWVGV